MDSRDKRLFLLIPPEEIHHLVERIAEEIRRDFEGKEPVFVGVLKGAFVFLSDLVRTLEIPLEIDFIQASSYGKRDVPSKDVVITRDITVDIKGRDVIVVEDIVDTGGTVRKVLEHLEKKEPSSLKLCSFLVRGEPGVRIDYCGKVIGGGFVVGYGLDYKERYRELKGVYIIEKGDTGK